MIYSEGVKFFCISLHWTKLHYSGPKVLAQFHLLTGYSFGEYPHQVSVFWVTRKAASL